MNLSQIIERLNVRPLLKQMNEVDIDLNRGKSWLPDRVSLRIGGELLPAVDSWLWDELIEFQELTTLTQNEIKD